MCARSDESGSVLPLMVLVVVVLALSAVVVGRLGEAATLRARAQAAADAVALAGAAEGREVAVQVATANDARVVEYSEQGRDTEVTVEVGSARATARATRRPPSGSSLSWWPNARKPQVLVAPA